MANHVHVLLMPKVDVKIIMQGIKGFTSHKINNVQEARGRVLWQDESYDHWARDEEEMQRIIAYIENNPVAAGLCEHTYEWPWSSAAYRSGLDWKAGEEFKPEWREKLSGWKA
jgi:REP element-mobilizing transposase RayT